MGMALEVITSCAARPFYLHAASKLLLETNRLTNHGIHQRQLQRLELL